jgi:hypothetical protein
VKVRGEKPETGNTEDLLLVPKRLGRVILIELD